MEGDSQGTITTDLCLDRERLGRVNVLAKAVETLCIKSSQVKSSHQQGGVGTMWGHEDVGILRHMGSKSHGSMACLAHLALRRGLRSTRTHEAACASKVKSGRVESESRVESSRVESSRVESRPARPEPRDACRPTPLRCSSELGRACFAPPDGTPRARSRRTGTRTISIAITRAIRASELCVDGRLHGVVVGLEYVQLVARAVVQSRRHVLGHVAVARPEFIWVFHRDEIDTCQAAARNLAQIHFEDQGLCNASQSVVVLCQQDAGLWEFSWQWGEDGGRESGALSSVLWRTLIEVEADIRVVGPHDTKGIIGQVGARIAGHSKRSV